MLSEAAAPVANFASIALTITTTRRAPLRRTTEGFPRRETPETGTFAQLGERPARTGVADAVLVAASRSPGKENVERSDPRGCCCRRCPRHSRAATATVRAIGFRGRTRRRPTVDTRAKLVRPSRRRRPTRPRRSRTVPGGLEATPAVPVIISSFRITILCSYAAAAASGRRKASATVMSIYNNAVTLRCTIKMQCKQHDFYDGKIESN